MNIHYQTMVLPGDAGLVSSVRPYEPIMPFTPSQRTRLARRPLRSKIQDHMAWMVATDRMDAVRLVLRRRLRAIVAPAERNMAMKAQSKPAACKARSKQAMRNQNRRKGGAFGKNPQEPNGNLVEMCPSCDLGRK